MISSIAADQATVSHIDNERYEILIRGHRVLVDQPKASGGENSAPTPTELFVGSLTACVAFYAGRYLSRHGFARDGLQVRASFDMATNRPARVASIRITVRPPAGFPPERFAALAAVASHCTVHNSIDRAPRIKINVE
jgi:putative redox protein